jgi:hypothetical protein
MLAQLLLRCFRGLSQWAVAVETRGVSFRLGQQWNRVLCRGTGLPCRTDPADVRASVTLRSTPIALARRLLSRERRGCWLTPWL